MLAWVDVETTGLEPKQDCLLEVGMIITDDELNELARNSVVLWTPPPWQPIPAEIQAMHTKNDLWVDCELHGMGRITAEDVLANWVKSLKEYGDVAATPLAGSTVHFDRAWLKAKMPRVERQFHYRNLDVSSIKELNKRVGFAEAWESDRKLHRALPDLEDSIAELLHYTNAIDQLCAGFDPTAV